VSFTLQFLSPHSPSSVSAINLTFQIWTITNTDRFDFNVSLQTYSKRLLTPTSSSNLDPSSSSIPSAPAPDFSLKAGQTFSIKIPGREGRERKRPEESGMGVSGGGFGAGGGVPLLPPPPGRKR
jgi:hypothetical protein